MPGLFQTLMICLATCAPVARAAGGAVFGVVPADSAAARGLEVAAVAPGSPAERAGLRAGDVLLSVEGKATRNRSDLLAAILAQKPGDCITVQYLRGSAPAAVEVTLAARKTRKARPKDTTDAGYKEHGDRMAKRLNIPPALLNRMRELKREIRHSLAQVDEDFDPAEVSDKLQQLRDLARDAQAQRHGWMVGRACEAYLQFHDDEGTLVLHGANNRLTLEVYDAAGQLLQTAPLNTAEERRALPEALIQRLHALQ